MRIPLAPAGAREMTILTLLFGGSTTVFAILGMDGHAWGWVVSGLSAVLWLFGIAFFRDPDRRVPDDAKALVAPADGKIVEVARLDESDYLDTPATRISIFLSIFDVHINRSPCSGVVRSIHYKEGAFLDARNPDSGHRNEANTIVIEPDAPFEGPIVVRQIAGLVARRIVCSLNVGDRVERGQRIGLIKFGSRTELIVPGHETYEPTVNVGDESRGARTIFARLASSRAPVTAVDSKG
jgi:phosphatidylserine decarboxylase